MRRYSIAGALHLRGAKGEAPPPLALPLALEQLLLAHAPAELLQRSNSSVLPWVASHRLWSRGVMPLLAVGSADLNRVEEGSDVFAEDDRVPRRGPLLVLQQKTILSSLPLTEEVGGAAASGSTTCLALLVKVPAGMIRKGRRPR